VTGRVVDQTGAVTAAASIVLTNVSAGTKLVTQANAEGYYTFSRLDPGQYELAVQHPGFRNVVRKGIVLQVDQTARVDVTLEVGSVTDSIEVTGAAPLVESETSDVGQVVGNKSIVEMPLNGRNAWDLSMLAGGTVYINGAGDAGEIPVVSMAGSRTVSQSLMLDGGSVQKSGLARAQAELSPMVDAVEEFKVVTNNYAAEYGRTAGGVFTAVTKSGTNQVRGTLFHFLRNNAFDARNFFAIEQAPLRYNQFGGTVGGPIIRNKTHFFAALENTMTTRGQTVILTLPTPAFKNGDFSALVNARGQRLPIYDPFSSRPDPNNPSLTVRDAFPGNIIPPSRFDPVAVKALSYYPDPNVPGNAAGGNNFNTNVAPKRTQIHGTLRVDHVLTGKDRLFFRYVRQYNEAPEAPIYPEPAASGVGPATRSIENAATSSIISWVRTISPSLLNDFKFTTINQARHITQASLDQGWADKLGLTGIGNRSFPIFRPAGYAILGGANPYREQTNPGYQFIDSLSWYRGSHSFKFGFEYRHNRTTDEFDRMPGGDITFAQAGTGLQGNANSGNGLATMLLGFGTAASINDSPLFAFSSYYIGMYAQDDWKITPRFTLNLGLRYDIEPGRIADGNTQNGFDTTKIHPTAGVPGVVTFAGVNEPVRVFNTDWNNFSPRFGFAWRPSGSENTVIRGGFGVFIGNPDDQGYNNSAVLGFTKQANFVSGDNQSAALVLRNGFRAVDFPGAQDRTDAFGVGNAIDFYQRERANPYSLQYNFGVQQQVAGVLVAVQYMGNLGRKLTGGSMSINQVRPELMGKPGTVQSRRPFPQFSDVLLDSPNIGMSSYHGMLWRAEKRYRNGMQFLVNYTWSKFIDNIDALIDFGGTPGAGYSNMYNRGADKAMSSNDIRHNASFSMIYELPWGPRRRWLTTGPASAILGGWQISTFGVLRTGPPWGATAQQNLCECNSAGPMRPNLLRDPNLPGDLRTPDRWFDIDAFTTPERLTFGNAARSLGAGPGNQTVNIALMKNFSIKERWRVQFRGEAFNAFNHTNLGLPNTTAGSANFGTINTAQDARVIQLGLKLYF
jgi:hypothetical protein